MSIAIAAISVAVLSVQSALAQTGQSIMADTIFARRIYVSNSTGASNRGVLITADDKSATVNLTSTSTGASTTVSLTANADRATVDTFDGSGNAAALGYRPDAPGAVRAYGSPVVPGQDNIVWSAP